MLSVCGIASRPLDASQSENPFRFAGGAGPRGEGSEYTERALGPLFDSEERVCRNIDEERFLRMTETMDLFNLLFEKEMERDLQKDE